MSKVYIITGYGLPDSLGFHIAKSIKENDKNAFILAIIGPTVDMQKVDYSACDREYVCDLSDPKQFLELGNIIKNAYPKIYCLVNCAGMNKMDWLENISYVDHQRVMDVNVNAPIFLTKKLVGNMDGGVILNIASMGARKPFRTSMPYNVSKAALVMATKQIAREVTRKFNTVVFAVSPNQLANTGMTKENEDEICRIRGWSLAEAEKYRKMGAMIDETTSPEVLADFISYLLVDRKRHEQLSGVELHYGE